MLTVSSWSENLQESLENATLKPNYLKVYPQNFPWLYCQAASEKSRVQKSVLMRQIKLLAKLQNSDFLYSVQSSRNNCFSKQPFLRTLAKFPVALLVIFTKLLQLQLFSKTRKHCAEFKWEKSALTGYIKSALCKHSDARLTKHCLILIKHYCDSNETRTHNCLIRKQTLNHWAKVASLAKWLSVH